MPFFSQHFSPYDPRDSLQFLSCVFRNWVSSQRLGRLYEQECLYSALYTAKTVYTGCVWVTNEVVLGA